MADAPASSPGTARLHLVSHISWERERSSSFELSRARLLDVLARLAVHMQAGPQGAPALRHLLLAGQTIILDDIAAVRPSLSALLVIYNAGGRLGVGPWYVQVDETLVSGESLIRNLLLGRADAARHGIKLQPLAYMPDAQGYAAQLPQLLQGFGIDTLFLRRPQLPAGPFRWRAPDGSTVLVINYHEQPDPAQTIAAQREALPRGPFLWMHDLTDPDTPVLPSLDGLDLPAMQSTIADYVQELRAARPDARRREVQGPLHPAQPGALATRLYLKQANAALQTLLSHTAEPWVTVALTHGEVDYPENLRGLLEYCWRLLIKNQARDTLGGCSVDLVHDESEIQNRHIADLSERVIDEALAGLAGRPQSAPPPPDAGETYVVVWNPHNWPVQQVVETPLELPPGFFPSHVFAPDGTQQMFGWAGRGGGRGGGRLTLRADVPPVGYAVYTVQFGPRRPGRMHETRNLPGQVIGGMDGETLVMAEGRLVWKRETGLLDDLLNFYDGGDAGSVYSYRSPQPDTVIQARTTDQVTVESGPLHQRLIVQHRMRIAPQLSPDGSRGRGVRLLDLTTSATFYDSTPGLYFHTSFSNTARDHRLRAHLRTGLQGGPVLVDSGFGLITHPEGAGPMQSLCAVQGAGGTMALLARGLPEVEALAANGSTELALTLLRAVGDGGAQCERDLEAEYALVPFPDGDEAALLRAAALYTAPLQSRQYSTRPPAARRSYLQVEGDVIMTALKPPQGRGGWIVRLLNPRPTTAETRLRPAGKLRLAHLVNLAEEPQAEFDIVENSIRLRLEAHKMVTVRLGFSAEA